MKRKEILNALHCCATARSEGDCVRLSCPLLNTKDCQHALFREAANEISDLQASLLVLLRPSSEPSTCHLKQ